MYGTSGIKDGDAGTLLPPAYMGYCYHFGGRKPPQSTVPLLQHTSTLACYKQESPCQFPVCQGGGKEYQAAGGGGSAGEFGEDLPGLGGTVGDHDIV